MKEDAEKMEAQNIIKKENDQLKTQYEALVKEIAEKSELMDKQLEEKEQSQSSIE